MLFVRENSDSTCVYYIYYILLRINLISLRIWQLHCNSKENIDLPVETLQKLSLMAVTQGKSLKKFIESILISKANSINLEVTENPSPSNDPWFADPENIAIVEKGLEQAKNGDVRTLSVDELQNLLGV